MKKIRIRKKYKGLKGSFPSAFFEGTVGEKMTKYPKVQKQIPFCTWKIHKIFIKIFLSVKFV